MTPEALWPYALDLYGPPEVEAAFLDLQDRHDQCVAYLIWSLWAADQGRTLDAAALGQGADLARAWQAAAIAPLRRMRRDLKSPLIAGTDAPRQALRGSVQALELEAERMLLQMLEALSPAPTEAGLAAAEALERAVRAWGAGDAPLADLVNALAPSRALL